MNTFLLALMLYWFLMPHLSHFNPHFIRSQAPCKSAQWHPYQGASARSLGAWHPRSACGRNASLAASQIGWMHRWLARRINITEIFGPVHCTDIAWLFVLLCLVTGFHCWAGRLFSLPRAVRGDLSSPTVVPPLLPPSLPYLALLDGLSHINVLPIDPPPFGPPSLAHARGRRRHARFHCIGSVLPGMF